MMKIYLSLILVWAFLCNIGVFAQPNLSIEEIPDDVHSEVKKKIEQLYSSDHVARAEAASELGEMRGKAVEPAIPFLIGMLGDGFVVGGIALAPLQGEEYKLPPPGKEAAKTLVALGEERRLLEFVKDRNVSAPIRGNAMLALGETAFPGVVETLLEVSLNDKEGWLPRKTAISTLGKIKDSRAVIPLINLILSNENPKDASVAPFDARVAAFYALGDIKDLRAVEPLLGIMKDDPVAGVWATAALQGISGKLMVSTIQDGNNGGSKIRVHCCRKVEI